MVSDVGSGRLVAALLGLGLAACAGPAAPIQPPAAAAAHLAGVDWAKTQAIAVTLTEYEFDPADLHLRQGQPYRLQFENRGTSSHTFTAPGLFATAALREGRAADEALSSSGTIALAAGETKEIDFVPLNAGHFPLDCSRPFHSAFGMKGEIIVD